MASEEELDVSVLRALPEDLRAEVMRTHTVSTAVKRKLARPPSPPPPPPPAEPLFAPEPAGPEHMARALRAWLRSMDAPQPVHLELIAQAAVESVERNATDIAYTVLETLRRHAETRSVWAEMYNLTLAEVQRVVRVRHRGQLPLRPL